MRGHGRCSTRTCGRRRFGNTRNVDLALGNNTLGDVLRRFDRHSALSGGASLFDLAKLSEARRLSGLLSGKRCRLRLLMCSRFGRGLRSRGGLLFRGGLHVCSAAPTAQRRLGRGRRRRGRRLDDNRSAAAGRRCRSVLSLRPRPLFPFPARAHAGDLVVREQTQMTAHRDVHLPKQTDNLIGGNPELASHVMNAKFAQTSSSRALGEPDFNNSLIPRASCESRIPTAAV
jgi:hypothetical protein